MTQMLENPMVRGEYFPDMTAFDRAAEMANGQNYVDFIVSRGDDTINAVVFSWLDMILTPNAVNKVWDSLEDYKREDICKRYTVKNLMDDFVNYVL